MKHPPAIARRAAAIGLTSVLVAALAITVAGLPAHADGQTVSVVSTSADGSAALTSQPSLTFATTSTSTDSARTIWVDDQRQYQSMLGWGATITDSSAHVIANDLTSAQRTTMMQKLFSPNAGIGLSFLRQPAGATDYTNPTTGYYTYDDGSADPTLTNFNASHDASELIPAVQAALAQNPQLLVQLTSWTAPAWMKTENNLFGGNSSTGDKNTLQPQYYSAYANYLVKAIQYYQQNGIPIWGTSAQNEPSVNEQYPGMYWDAGTLNTFTNSYLAPALAQAGLQPQVMAADDVCFDSPLPSGELSNASTDGNTSAVSLHGYCGTYQAVSNVHYSYPYKSIYQTELATDCPTRGAETTGTAASPPPSPDLNTNNLDTFPDFLVSMPRNWARLITTWNVALEQEPRDTKEPNWDRYGPLSHGNGYCTPIVSTPNGGGAPTYLTNYYWLGQFSKFVQRGAVRIGSNTWGVPGPGGTQDIEDVAFRNPSGEDVVVAYNPTGTATPITVRSGSQTVSYTLGARTMATFRWTGSTSGALNNWGPAALADPSTNPLGVPSGTWVSTSPTAVSATQPTGSDASWHPTFTGGDVALAKFTASVNVTRTSVGTDPVPKYGVYACYATDSNYLQVWIDPNNGQLVTHGVLNGADMGWHPVSLPGGFSPSAQHTIGWSRTGNTIRFSLDGVDQSGLATSVGTTLPYCQIGLVTENTDAQYSGLSITDDAAWGGAAQANDGSNPYGGGPQTGTWRVNSPASVDSLSVGEPWNSIFSDAHLGSVNYTYSVGAQQVHAGGTAGVGDKYGVYGCYKDGSNYVQGWIDPGNHQFVIHAVNNGTDTGWSNVSALPGGFDPFGVHTVSVTKSGSTYSFTLDGAAVGTAITLATSYCQVGLVTQDMQANFRSVSAP